jgi:preprotein translocase subunit SecE
MISWAVVKTGALVGCIFHWSPDAMWIRDYLQNVVEEMKKVNWPSRDELISSTLITIVATLIISGIIFLADQAISTTLNFLYQQ